MKKTEFFSGQFLKAEQLKRPDGEYDTRVLTINSVNKHVFDDGGEQIVLEFDETDQPYGFSAKVVWEQLEEVTGESDSDDWVGHKIELYVDKTVKFKGKPTPALRVRKPAGAKAPAKTPPAANNAPPPEDSGEAPPPPPADVEAPWDKNRAWNEFCSMLEGKPDVPLWKKGVAEIANGRKEAQLTSDDWKAIAKTLQIPF